MNHLKTLIRWLFTPPTPAPSNPNCKHCLGIGFDASGYQCTCVGEKA